MFILPEYVAREGRAELHRNSNILRNDPTVLQSGSTILHPRSSVWGLQFPPSLPKTTFHCPSLLFQPWRAGGGDMVSCYGCGLYFPDNKWCGTPPHLLIGHWDIFLGERTIHILCPFKNQIVILLLKEFFLYFGHKSLITSMICNRCLFWAIVFFFFHFLNNALWSTNVCGVSEVWYICFCHQLLLCHI